MYLPIKVVVQGALGRVGREVLNAVARDPQTIPVGAIEKNPPQNIIPLAGKVEKIPVSNDAEEIIKTTRPDVLVDFSTIEAIREVIPIAVKEKVNLVIGTTGFTEQDITGLRSLVESKPIGILIAPNFSIGAVLLIHLSKIAARYFEYVEIIEQHHEQKVDAPSGTALATARAMLESRKKPFEYAGTQKQTHPGTRGGQLEGVAIHSVRLPGLMAHQEVIFGGLGQTLTLRHDSISRESFVPGVLLAIKQIVNKRGLIIGLENLLGL